MRRVYRMLSAIKNNPYRVLGVLCNTPLKERVGNKNRLVAFAKVGKEVSFPNDFASILSEKPLRTIENIASANAALNLDGNRLKYALFWFINGSPIDEIALKHVRAGNIDKARELFEKKDTFSSLINLGVLNFISGDVSSGLNCISTVIHNKEHRTSLFRTLDIGNLIMSENEIASMFIEEVLKEVPASVLLSAAVHPQDKALIEKIALEGPISVINSAIEAVNSVNHKDADANLQAGTKLMNSTKTPLESVKTIVGASSPQYQTIADNLAKTVEKCGYNYYNNAPVSDTQSPRKAMVLQSYALSIAVGQATRKRCQDNYDFLKDAIDNMPPDEVAIEARKIDAELKEFCSQPDKIEYSISLLNATKPLLQTIKSKLGAENSYYLHISTNVVGNALHNLIEEVNVANNTIKNIGIGPGLRDSLLLNTYKLILKEAWRAITIMDSFDMEYEFKRDRYNINRGTLKELCSDCKIPTNPSVPCGTTQIPTASPSRLNSSSGTSSSSSPNSSSSSSSENSLAPGCLAAITGGLIVGIICLCKGGGLEGFIGGFIGVTTIGGLLAYVLNDK